MAFKAFLESLFDLVCLLVHIPLQVLIAVPPARDDCRGERQYLLVSILSCQGCHPNPIPIVHETIPDIYAAGVV